MRNSLNNNIFLLKLKIWSTKCNFSFILTKYCQILQVTSFLTSDFRRVCWVQHWLLVIVSFRYQNRPCLGREWVIDHQYLRRFRSHNRVLKNNAIYGRRCRMLSVIIKDLFFKTRDIEELNKHSNFHQTWKTLMKIPFVCLKFKWQNFLILTPDLWGL